MFDLHEVMVNATSHSAAGLQQTDDGLCQLLIGPQVIVVVLQNVSELMVACKSKLLQHRAVLIRDAALLCQGASKG